MGKAICSVSECGGKHKGFGYCNKHYQRYIKYGTTDLPDRTRLCVGPRCTRKVDANQGTGLCRSHYKQMHLGKPLTPLLVATKDLGRPDVCIVEGCDRPHKARGLCKGHNDHAKAGKELRPLQLRLPPGPCAVDGCERLRFANGYCTKHNANRLTRWKMYGITPEEGFALYEEQGQACAICRNSFPLESLHVDHDHACCPKGRGACGRCVRGLLCQGCNIAIGYMKDDPRRLLAAARYLGCRAS